ncbi:hypothetical protein VP95_30170 [Burkholderia pseudomallei]|nr:hypothetical protein VP95_30170 [Burkholderia pseudomallei]OND63031.1 hypothetical protein AQ937_07705 [Burkholderia pseudomallei]OND68442.1 hypothetical protein AQ936_27230 [Burkholderia pseudomallei]OND86322.1 hypothetical protein AQ940_01000 [Burkholderia pseudomallei]
MADMIDLSVAFLPSSGDIEQSTLSEDYTRALREFYAFAKAQGGLIPIQGSSPNAPVGMVVEFAKVIVPLLGPALGAAVTGWFQGRTGRKLRLKVGDVEIEARTPEEVEQLLKQARARQTDQRGKEK